jgi:hypothetical protein
MNKILFTISILLMTTNVFGGWELYGTTKGIQLFYDKPSIKRSGNMVRVWNYMNFNHENVTDPAILKIASTRSLTEIDCINETYKDLTFDTYSEPHLKGKLEDMTPDKNIEYIPPNSTIAKLMKLVCRK